MLDAAISPPSSVSGPELIPPSEWLPQVWGQREDDDEAGVVSTRPNKPSTWNVLHASAVKHCVNDDACCRSRDHGKSMA